MTIEFGNTQANVWKFVAENDSEKAGFAIKEVSMLDKKQEFQSGNSRYKR